MKYLLLIYSDEAMNPAPEDLPGSEEMAAYRTLNENLAAAGSHLGGEPLVGVAEARTVRERDGDVVVTDGPFAETKEQLGGFYLVDVGTIDEAVEWAKQIPAVKHGSIEVRQVMEIPGVD